MTEDVKALFSEALGDLEKQRNSPVSKALREIIALEKANYYNKRVLHSRLKSIKAIISKYSQEGA